MNQAEAIAAIRDSHPAEPSGYWVRSYPDPQSVERLAGIETIMSPRCALDDRNRLYFRAKDYTGIASLLTDILQGKVSSPEPRAAVSPSEQTVLLGIKIRRPIVYRAVLKTGFNFVAYLTDEMLVRDSAFYELRRILFDEGADEDVMSRCQFLDDSKPMPRRERFPPPADTDQHRLMLDIVDGQLRFRMRLYGHLGYECILAMATANIRKRIATSRAVVDFESTGIREVSKWT